MNSLGDNRSSKILFGKRKIWPLQFLRIRKPPLKLFERIFCWVKNKKKNTLQKTPSTIRRKIPVLFGCFQKKFTNYFHAKRGSPKSESSNRIIPTPKCLLPMINQFRSDGYVLSSDNLKYTEPRLMQIKFGQMIVACNVKKQIFTHCDTLLRQALM